MAVLDGAVGSWLVWKEIADIISAHPATGREVIAGSIVLVIAGRILVVIYALEPPSLVTFLGTAITGGAAVGAPLLGKRLSCDRSYPP